MVQLAFVMRILSLLYKCVKANSTPEEGDEKNDTRQNTRDNVDGTEVVVTNTTVSNVTCCGAKATSQNQDEVYSKTPVTTTTSNIHEEQARSDDDQSSSETIPSTEEYSRKRGSRIILEINSFEYPE